MVSLLRMAGCCGTPRPGEDLRSRCHRGDPSATPDAISLCLSADRDPPPPLLPPRVAPRPAVAGTSLALLPLIIQLEALTLGLQQRHSQRSSLLHSLSLLTGPFQIR